MKRIQLLIVFLVLPFVVIMSQQNHNDLQKVKDDLQKVKDALVTSVIYCQELEKQNANLNIVIKKVAEDLKKVVNIEQLDSLKVVYGIEKRKEIIKK
jgi:hypothetical protein